MVRSSRPARPGKWIAPSSGGYAAVAIRGEDGDKGEVQSAMEPTPPSNPSSVSVLPRAEAWSRRPAQTS